MELVRFLLARIAEDEAAAVRARGLPVPPGLPDADRVLAECVAKRGVIQLQRTDLTDDPDDWEATEVLSFLALPYAGHPDYRREWRP